jgi:hypothetical protein
VDSGRARRRSMEVMETLVRWRFVATGWLGRLSDLILVSLVKSKYVTWHQRNPHWSLAPTLFLGHHNITLHILHSQVSFVYSYWSITIMFLSFIFDQAGESTMRPLQTSFCYQYDGVRRPLTLRNGRNGELVAWKAPLSKQNNM